MLSSEVITNVDMFRQLVVVDVVSSNVPCTFVVHKYGNRQDDSEELG